MLEPAGEHAQLPRLLTRWDAFREAVAPSRSRTKVRPDPIECSDPICASLRAAHDHSHDTNRVQLLKLLEALTRLVKTHHRLGHRALRMPAFRLPAAVAFRLIHIRAHMYDVSPSRIDSRTAPRASRSRTSKLPAPWRVCLPLLNAKHFPLSPVI